MKADEIVYSEKIKGAPRNYRFAQRFDLTGDGVLGIQQFDGDKAVDRVLLSPQQVKCLIAFLREHKQI